VTLPVAGTPVMRSWHLIHLARKRLSPIAQAFKDFLLDEGAALVRRTVGGDARAVRTRSARVNSGAP